MLSHQPPSAWDMVLQPFRGIPWHKTGSLAHLTSILLVACVAAVVLKPATSWTWRSAAGAIPAGAAAASDMTSASTARALCEIGGVSSASHTFHEGAAQALAWLNAKAYQMGSSLSAQDATGSNACEGMKSLEYIHTVEGGTPSMGSSPHAAVIWMGVDSGSHIVVAFRGNIAATKLGSQLEPHEQVAPFAAPELAHVTVHPALWQAYETIRNRTVAELLHLARGHRTATVVLTGHSIGGALASIAALDLMQQRALFAPPIVYTFGAPRVGNAGFARALTQAAPNSFRVVHKDDVIAHNPPAFNGFQHGLTEVWYASRMPKVSTAPSQLCGKAVGIPEGDRGAKDSDMYTVCTVTADPRPDITAHHAFSLESPDCSASEMPAQSLFNFVAKRYFELDMPSVCV